MMESTTYGSERWMPDNEPTDHRPRRARSWGRTGGVLLVALLVGAGAMWGWMRWMPPAMGAVPPAVQLPRGKVALVIDDPTNNLVLADEVLLTLAEASGDEAQCDELHGHPFIVGPSPQPSLCIIGEAAVLQRWNGKLIVAAPLEVAAIVHSATAAGQTMTVLPAQWDEPQTADAPSMVEPVKQD